MKISSKIISEETEGLIELKLQLKIAIMLALVSVIFFCLYLMWGVAV